MTVTAAVKRECRRPMAVYQRALRKMQLSGSTLLLLCLAVWMFVAAPAALAAEHYDFTYPDRQSLLAAGWNYLAVTSAGAARNTEQTTGAVPSYDQAAHPGILRIPADTGDLWENQNNTRNSLFRNLPLNWTSIRLKLSFNPSLNYQQAGLLVYQDDDNYVQVTRIYENRNSVTFANEQNAIAGIVTSLPETATAGLYLRLDRDPQDKITGYYSRDGSTWISLGSVTQSLANPRLAIVVGASPNGYPNADLAYAEVETGDALPPPAPVSVATWKDNHKGALSISTDDGDASCFDKLQAYGFTGTYVMNGTVAPSFYTDYFNAGMELGSHLANHVCFSVSDTALRQENIEPSIDGICSTTPQLCKDVISLVWPCGYTNSREEGIASDYFLSARGYNINQLENPTPSDFFNLKSFNSHEHAPYPPSDLKTVVTMAEQQGKWANLVFHTACNDDGAIAHAASRDIWVAPIGTVIKYILQRDRVMFKDYLQDTDTISFSFARTPLKASAIRSFETAINAKDTVSLLVSVDGSRHIASVRLNGATSPYQVKTIGGNAVLLLDTAVGTGYTPVEIRYQSSATPPVITLSPVNVTFNAVQGTNPASQAVALSNGGGGTMTWTAAANTSAPAWLSASPASGTGDSNLTLSVASAALAPGTYTKTVTVAATGASNTPQTVAVTLTVVPAQPAIALAPSKLTFMANAGSTTPSQTVALSNGGSGTMTWTATADSVQPAWLSVSPATGTGAASLSVSVTSAALTPGTYSKDITITAPGANNTPQTLPVTLTVLPANTTHYDFTYSDRSAFLAAGWSFLAATSTGNVRNTEQVAGIVVSYDQAAHPGILRIPADSGDLWAGLNNTRNSLFRTLPANWTGIRLKLSFAPTQNYQQAGLLAYQDDNNYVQVCRIFENGNRITMARETAGAATNVASVTETATANLFLRLDREPATERITGQYSVNGTTWVSLGSVTQALTNPKLAIVVGASPGGFPNADVAWAEVITTSIPPAISVSPMALSFTSVSGANPPDQTVTVANSGGGTLSWTATAEPALPAWLSVVPGSGTGTGSLTVSVTAAGLAPGVYTRNITIAAAGGSNSPRTVPVTLTVQPSGTEHHDFIYPDRSSLLAGGWSFLATTSAGTARNTEQLTGTVISYDQAAHPGVIRIPADSGDLWAGLNNTRNSLFRPLPANWTGVRLKLSFAPTQNYQQAGLLAYQDDNNYVQVCRIFEGGNRMTMIRETGGAATNVNAVPESATANLFLRLDRDPATEKITAHYSVNGTTWISLGSVTQALANAKLAIVVGASPGGFPNADIAWAEVLTTPVPPAIAVSPKALSFTSVAGANPPGQKLAIVNSGGGTLSWTATADSTVPAWLSVVPASGTGDTDLAVAVVSAGLDPGTYTKNITIAAAGGSNTPQVVPVTLTVLPSGTEHRDFAYPDRASLLAAGWDFVARTSSGASRNTEQTAGAVVSYDQTAHPGILRIPADTGDLWAGLNNTRNTLFRDLPSNWTSIRLKLSFSPTRNYQQAGLVAYQDDNNYVQICRIFENGNRMTLVREANGAAANVSAVVEATGSNLHLRLDRDPAIDRITALYSLDGLAWISLGGVTKALTAPRLAIVVGASPGGLPNADLAWTEVLF